jgi:hypothetical protein
VVYVLESNQGVVPYNQEGNWLDAAQIAAGPLKAPHHRPIIETYLREIEQGAIPAQRPPWSRPGWFAEASLWIAQELARHGYVLLSPVEQVDNWCLSCVLRAPTTRGDVYLKVSPDLPLFVNEAAVVSKLAERFPQNIPRPLSVDLRRRWMLLDDFGPHLAKRPSIEARRAMVRRFAHLQQTAIDQVPQLLEMGCIDRRLQTLAKQIEGLASDRELADSLSGGELGQLRGGAATFKAMCRELADVGIPETLNHGDLHLGNVARRNGRLLFFDWTDASVAHPFLDMISIFNERDEVLRSRLRDHYLALWGDYGPPAQLRRAWTLAEPLFALHQAVSYQSILRHLEEPSRQGFGDVLPHYVRRALTGLDIAAS